MTYYVVMIYECRCSGKAVAEPQTVQFGPLLVAQPTEDQKRG